MMAVGRPALPVPDGRRDRRHRSAQADAGERATPIIGNQLQLAYNQQARQMDPDDRPRLARDVLDARSGRTASTTIRLLIEAQHRRKRAARRALLRRDRPGEDRPRSRSGAATRAIRSASCRPAPARIATTTTAGATPTSTPRPDNSFTNMEAWFRYYTNCIQIIDVADPAQPDLRRQLVGAGPAQGGGRRVPQVEGIRRQDLVDEPARADVRAEASRGGRALRLQRVRLVRHAGPRSLRHHEIRAWSGASRPPHKPGAIHFHTIDVARLDRGFVIANPEVLNPDCNELYQPIWVVDVRDATNPKPIYPVPGAGAAAGRAVPGFLRQARALRAAQSAAPQGAGQAAPELHGLRASSTPGCSCSTSATRARPKNTGYFIPPQPGSLDDYLSYPRDTDAVFVEWDRKLMWVGTGHRDLPRHLAAARASRSCSRCRHGVGAGGLNQGHA